MIPLSTEVRTEMRIREISETVTTYDFVCVDTGQVLYTIEVEWLEGFYA